MLFKELFMVDYLITWKCFKNAPDWDVFYSLKCGEKKSKFPDGFQRVVQSFLDSGGSYEFPLPTRV